MSDTWVYIQSEPRLYTVGFYAPDGSWHTDSDHGSKQEAADRVHYLNGGQPVKEETDCDRKECGYYRHYLVWYDPDRNGVKLEHEAFHEVEQRCADAQRTISKWMDEHPNIDPLNDPHGSFLWKQAEKWERKGAF